MRERTFSKPQVKSDTGKINNLHPLIIQLFKTSDETIYFLKL